MPEDWLFGAGRDVALQFGLGPEAAVAHLLNCLGRPIKSWKQQVMNRPSWRRDVHDLVSEQWSHDASEIAKACGEPRNGTVAAAVSRPSSPHHDDLLVRAAEQEQVATNLPEAYGIMVNRR